MLSLVNQTFIYDLPTLAERFNCYLPQCNITSEMDLITGVRPIYITQIVDYSPFMFSFFLFDVVLLSIALLIIIRGKKKGKGLL